MHKGHQERLGSGRLLHNGKATLSARTHSLCKYETRSIYFLLFRQFSMPPYAIVEKEADCPPGWASFGSSCFYVSEIQQNWFESEQHCKSLKTNSGLASCLSGEERIFLEAKTSGLGNFFVGANDL